MAKQISLILVLLLANVVVHAAEPAASPYVGQEARAIKALSEDEIQGLLAGKGLGFAKSAELNGYPGPAHVLELAESLDLSEEQSAATRAIHARMEAQARAFGTRLVEAETKLENLFHAGDATHEALNAALEDIASLQASLRGTHLAAHVDQYSVLSPQQVAAYVRLRGYHEGTHDRGGHH